MNKFFLVLLFSLLFFSTNVFAQEQPWDFLRPLNSIAESLTGVTTWIVFVLSGVLMGIAFLAYRRKKTQRYLFLALAFGFFFFKWLLKTADLYFSPGHFLSWAAGTVFELLIFALLFLALFKR